MLWMKNGQKSKVTNCTPIGITISQGHLKQVDRGTFIIGTDRFLQILP